MNRVDNYIEYMLRKCNFIMNEESNWSLICGTAIDTPNTYSVLYDFLPAAVHLAVHKAKGFNLVDSGAMWTRHIFYMLAIEMDPLLFRLDLLLQQGSNLNSEDVFLTDKVPNSRLSTTKLTQTLQQYGYTGTIPDVKEACRASIVRMKAAGETLAAIDALLRLKSQHFQ